MGEGLDSCPGWCQPALLGLGAVFCKGSQLLFAFNLVLLVNPCLTSPWKHLGTRRAFSQDADHTISIPIISPQSTQEEVSSEEEDEEMPEVSVGGYVSES